MTKEVPEVSEIKSRFVSDRLRMKQATQMAEVSKPTVYQWIRDGCFKSWTVKGRGRLRGIRFIDRKSFEEFLAGQREEVMQ
jgi:hypothetical protein